MLTPFEAIPAVRMEIPSNLDLVDEFVARAARLAFGESLLSDEPFSIVLRELLKNAIMHGNGEDSARSVRVSVNRVNGGTLKVTVEDEGAGFEYPGLGVALEADGGSEPTSGYELITRHCHRLEFGESGRRVTAHFLLGRRGSIDTQWIQRMRSEPHGRIV